MRQHRLERPSAFLQAPYVSPAAAAAADVVVHVGGRAIANVAAVDDEDDGVADGVVARPH